MRKAKVYSIINRNGHIELSPCYDLLNTTIELKNPVEEIALPLGGKKKDLIDISFLSIQMKEKYLDLLNSRLDIIFL